VVYNVHVISKNIDGGATEADGGASAPVGPSVATPLDGGQLERMDLNQWDKDLSLAEGRWRL